MTWPSAATKVHMDQASDDPKQARAELADLVDQFNTLRSHFTSFAQNLATDATAALARTRLDAQQLDTTLTSIAALTGLTDHSLIRADGTVGLYQDSGWTLNDSDVIAGAGNTLQDALLTDIAEGSFDVGNIGAGPHDFDYTNGHVQAAQIEGSPSGTVTFSFSNLPATGAAWVSLILDNGGSQTITWPTGITWAGGSAPALTEVGRDILVIMTIDGGGSPEPLLYGALVMLDMK